MAKTKALISFAVTAKLICAFGFAYADCSFSREVAHILFWKYVKHGPGDKNNDHVHVHRFIVTVPMIPVSRGFANFANFDLNDQNWHANTVYFDNQKRKLNNVCQSVLDLVILD